MRRCLEQEIGLPYVNFKSIGDYVILMCYFMKLLDLTKTEIKAFIRDFEKSTPFQASLQGDTHSRFALMYVVARYCDK